MRAWGGFPPGAPQAEYLDDVSRGRRVRPYGNINGEDRALQVIISKHALFGVIINARSNP